MTSELNNHVFQTYSEQCTRGQFIITIEQLRVYAAEHFREDTEYLRPLFKDLIAPIIPKPVKPKSDKIKKEVVASGDKKALRTTDLRTDDEKKVDNLIFTEQVKNWVKETKRLDGTIRALYEIVWGQCSRIMQAGVRGMPSFDTMEETSDLISLLQKVRQLTCMSMMLTWNQWKTFSLFVNPITCASPCT